VPLPSDKPPDRFLTLQKAQDQIEVELIAVKKILERQEGVSDLEHRRDCRKDPFMSKVARDCGDPQSTSMSASYR
jgi:hypothetical protein